MVSQADGWAGRAGGCVGRGDVPDHKLLSRQGLVWSTNLFLVWAPCFHAIAPSGTTVFVCCQRGGSTARMHGGGTTAQMEYSEVRLTRLATLAARPRSDAIRPPLAVVWKRKELSAGGAPDGNDALRLLPLIALEAPALARSNPRPQRQCILGWNDRTMSIKGVKGVATVESTVD